MSGIYIPSISMPESCGDCFACKAILSAEKKVVYICCFTGKEYSFDGKRVDPCPLISIPDHGRLIDADVAEVITFDGSANNGDFYDGVLFAADWIAAQPTIIPADEQFGKVEQLEEET